MFKLAKVNGDSMLPCYRHNDFLLLSTYRPKLKVGDDIVCLHPRFNTIFKRISLIKDNKIHLTGLNSISTSSQELGYVEKNDVIGRVVWHIKQPKQ